MKTEQYKITLSKFDSICFMFGTRMNKNCLLLNVFMWSSM
jgi:hypothetical protein